MRMRKGSNDCEILAIAERRSAMREMSQESSNGHACVLGASATTRFSLTRSVTKTKQPRNLQKLCRCGPKTTGTAHCRGELSLILIYYQDSREEVEVQDCRVPDQHGLPSGLEISFLSHNESESRFTLPPAPPCGVEGVF